MEQKKISIIIPVYNVELYLRECLDSVVNQTYRNLQIIIIDDGSTDGCPTICDEYAENDDRIIVKHQENAGLSVARNVGIEMIEADYVCFLDSDDYFMPKFCETMMTALMEQDVDIVVCETALMDEQSRPLPNDRKRSGLGTRMVDQEYFLTQCTDPVDFTCTAPGKLYKTSLFDDIRYPVGTAFEDVATTYRIGTKIDEAYFINEPLHCYRMRTGSLSRDAFSIKDSQRLHQIRETLLLATHVSKEQEEIARKCLAKYCYEQLEHAIKTGNTSQKDALAALVDEIDKAEAVGIMETVRSVRKWAIRLEKTVIRQAVHVKKECPVNETFLARTAYRLMTKLQKR